MRLKRQRTKSTTSTLGCACALLTAGIAPAHTQQTPTSGVSRAEAAVPAPLANVHRIVCLGDSITQGGEGAGRLCVARAALPGRAVSAAGHYGSQRRHSGPQVQRHAGAVSAGRAGSFARPGHDQRGRQRRVACLPRLCQSPRLSAGRPAERRSSRCVSAQRGGDGDAGAICACARRDAVAHPHLRKSGQSRKRPPCPVQRRAARHCAPSRLPVRGLSEAVQDACARLSSSHGRRPTIC